MSIILTKCAVNVCLRASNLKLVGSTARQSMTEHSLPFDSCSRVLFRKVIVICLVASRVSHSLLTRWFVLLFVCLLDILHECCSAFCSVWRYRGSTTGHRRLCCLPERDGHMSDRRSAVVSRGPSPAGTSSEVVTNAMHKY